jgi:hypothetical protein
MELLTSYPSNCMERSLSWEANSGRKPIKHGHPAASIQLVTKYYAFGTINSLTSYIKSSYHKLQYDLPESMAFLSIVFKICIP